METFHYTGVGSREAPEEACKLFVFLGAHLGSLGGILRSGHAEGPDMAFETGSPLRVGNHFALGREIYLPWKGFNGCRKVYHPTTSDESDDKGYYAPDYRWRTYDQAIELAKSVIPWWDKLKDSHKSLHTRNVYQVLGKVLDAPSELLICYCLLDKDGEPKGGTRTAIKLAEAHNVPVFNRFEYDSDDAFMDAIQAHLNTLTHKDANRESPDHRPEQRSGTQSEVDPAGAAERGSVPDQPESGTEPGPGAADQPDAGDAAQNTESDQRGKQSGGPSVDPAGGA